MKGGIEIAEDAVGFITAKVKFILAKTEIIDLTKEIAIKAGEIKKMMRNSHPNFGLADAILYETAQSVNAPVLTGDEHFKGVENVIYIKA